MLVPTVAQLINVKTADQSEEDRMGQTSQAYRSFVNNYITRIIILSAWLILYLYVCMYVCMYIYVCGFLFIYLFIHSFIQITSHKSGLAFLETCLPLPSVLFFSFFLSF